MNQKKKGYTNNSYSKQEVEHMLSTELPKSGFPKGIDILDNFLTEIKEDKRFTEKHTRSIKKLVIGIRIFRLAACGFFQMLSNFLGSFNRNVFEASVFDSVLTILFSDETFSNLYGLKHSSIGKMSSQAMISISNSVISEKKLKKFGEFFVECKKKDIGNATNDLLGELFALVRT
jgi:hypothetical protein